MTWKSGMDLGATPLVGVVRGGWRVVLVLLATCLLTMLAATPASATIQGLEVGDYQDDFGVSQSQAEAALKIQDRGTKADIVGDLEQSLGNQYAGVWFDNEAGEFVVPVVGAAPEKAAGVLGAIGLQGDFRLTAASSTWPELEAAHERIDNALLPLIKERLVQTSLDPRTNAVVIDEAADISAAARTRIEALVRGEGVSVEVKRHETDRFHAVTNTCVGSLLICSKPLRGGVRLEPSGSTCCAEDYAFCSVGFRGYGGGNSYVLTAGHCVKGFADFLSFPNAFESRYIGHVAAASFPVHDYAAINTTGSYWDQPSWPAMVAYWGTDLERTINYESSSYLGEYVCHAGARTGASCGYVITLDRTVPYEEPGTPTVYNVTEFATPCSFKGDSGGPVFAGNTALGIFSGSTAKASESEKEQWEHRCTVNGLYTEITEATDLLGVSVAPRVGAPPVATTGNVTSLQPQKATVAAKVDPNGLSTIYYFQYGTSPSYGSSTVAWSAGSGWQPGQFSGTIEGLKGNTTYYYRLIAGNSSGSSTGAGASFTTPDWRPTVTTEAPSSVTTEAATLKGSVNPQATATKYRFEYGKTIAYGTSVPVPDASVGSGTSAVAVSQAISGLRPERTYHFRIVASNVEGTNVTADRTFTTKAIPATYATAFGTKGTGNGQLQRPLGIARDAAGNLWVADADNNRIQKFNAKGEYLSQFGSKGSGNGQLSEPRGIAFTPQGNLWVTDAGNGRIEEFTPQGTYIQQAGIAEGISKIDSLTQPYGIAIDSQGRIWVTDPGGARVVRFSETVDDFGSHYVASFSNLWIGQPNLVYPTGIAADAQDALWITDSTNNKVYKLAYDAVWLVYKLDVAFGTAGTGEGQLSEPRGIAVKPSGNLMIAEKANNRVQIFSPAGEYLSGFGTKGSGSGQMLEPGGLVQGAGGTTYVTDSGNNRIQKWSQPWEPDAVTLAASGLSSTGATLNGTVNPSGTATTYRFEYGKTTAYGTSVPIPDASAGSGTEAVAVSKALSGLDAESFYHYRIVATNAEGTAYGADKTFTTAVPMTAFQANDGFLWIYSPTFGANNTALGMKSGTSPSATTLSNGTHQVAFQDNQGNLWLYSPTAGASNTGLGMAAGTSPSIAALPGGGYVVAFQANTGVLWTYSSVSGAKNTGLSIRAGNTPSIAAMPDGSYRVAYGAVNSEFCLYSSVTGQSTCPGYPTYSNLVIAPTPAGSYTAAWRDGSGILWTYTPSTYKITGFGIRSSTNPAIVAMPDGSYRVAFQETNGELSVYSSVTSGKTATGQVMKAATSPSIVASPAGGYEAAFQAANTELAIYNSSSGSTQGTELGMMTGTWPSIG